MPNVKYDADAEEETGIGEIVIFDAVGKKLLQQAIPAYTRSVTLDVSSLQNGLHLCSLYRNEEKTATKKLMIVR